MSNNSIQSGSFVMIGELTSFVRLQEMSQMLSEARDASLAHQSELEAELRAIHMQNLLNILMVGVGSFLASELGSYLRTRYANTQAAQSSSVLND